MSFYTALTGLNAASSQLTVTSNNIANIGTTGFKRSRADFGDIFATSPLQKAASVVGQGVSLKAVTQQFSQGNIEVSANALDMAISGDGFFPLKSSDGLQDIYTRNGSFSLDDSFNVVNSQGQSLVAAAVDSSGKADLSNLSKLQLARKTSGDARETTAVDMNLNFPADAPVITAEFDPNNPATFSKTSTVTVYDTGGNGYLATIYYVKTQVASPADPTNKWQTHVYIGDTKLQEDLIQANRGGERLYVNKYGEVRAESDIPPDALSRGVNKLYKYDDLKNARQSTAATITGQAMAPAVNNLWKVGIDLANEVLSGTKFGSAGTNPQLVFDLSVDGSTPQRLDLSDYIKPDNVGKTLTGVEMAQQMTNLINTKFGDDRYFNLDGELTGASNPPTKFMTVTLTRDGLSDVTVPIQFADSDFITGTKQITGEAIAQKIQTALDEKSEFKAADGTSLVAVSFNSVSHKLQFDTSLLKISSGSATVNLSSDTPSSGLFGLSQNPISTDAYNAQVIPNGAYKLSSKDQRLNIKVQYDEDKGTFSVSSGTTGDESSVSISIPNDADLGTNARNLISSVFGLKTEDTPVASTPTRGVSSSPAVLVGNTIGLNLSNKFRVDESNNQFVVTVDNVTGIITIPPKAEYSAEEFRQALENRINSLSDEYGRSVSGVQVNIEGATNKYFTIKTGTTGDNAFIKISANSIWGLSNVDGARGRTSTWQTPQQARNAAGFPLYVDRNGLQTSNPGDFSEAQVKDLWAPVYLDQGELTFDSSGKMLSPNESIVFQSTTIGDSGATLEFSISYGASTQYSSPFSVRKQDQNGRPEGDLIGVEIGDDGLVSASYSNGTQKSIAKIVLANFSNPTGLRQIGDSSYYSSAKSGIAKLGEAGSAGFGSLRGGARERANVDLTQELVDLITAQRNFQANAKAIETNNQLTQTIINLRS